MTDQKSILTRRFFSTQQITLLKNGIHVQKKGLYDSTDYEISYENINTKKKVQTSVGHGFLISAFIAILIEIIILIGGGEPSGILFILIILLIVMAYATKERLVILKCFDGEEIKLHFNRRNKADVIQFTNEIIEHTNTFLLNKYSRIDKDLPIDNQLHNLMFLLDREIIAEAEYENLKNVLLGRSNKPKIGFS